MSLYNGFFQSKNIKVFPCAYRGYYKEANGTEVLFNPEACTTSEFSFVNSYNKISVKKESYVVEWIPATGSSNNGQLKVVLGGYYFEINNCTIDDFFNGSTPKTLYIKVGTPIEGDSSLVLTSIDSLTENTESNVTYLDALLGTTDNIDNYYFTGLQCLTTKKTGSYTASLTPFNELKEINHAAYPVSRLLDTSTGKYSLRMLEDIENSVDNSTTASGNYAVALGKNTTASGNISTALGNTTEARGANSLAIGDSTKAIGVNSFVGGSNSEAKGNNSFAFGSNVKTNATNQVVFGTYNVEDTDQAFIIANGTETAHSNKFTVGYNGNIKALGTATIEGATTINDSLTTKGNIIVNKIDIQDAEDNTKYTSSNNLILGSYTTETYKESVSEKNEDGNIIYKEEEKTRVLPHSGTISVYGQNPNSEDDKVFSVTNNGKTYIADVTDASATDGALKVNGGVRIDKQLNVGSNANINGSLTTTGNITANGTTNNDLVLGTTSDGSYGSIQVYGESSSKVFETTKEGNTTIEGITSITNSTTSTSTNTGALKVTGGVGIGENLNVEKNLSVFGNIAIGPNVASTNNSSVIHSFSINNNTASLNVPTIIENKTSSDNSTLEIKGNVKITGAKANLQVEGPTTINGLLTHSGDFSFVNKKVEYISEPEENSPNFIITGNTKINGNLTLTEGLTSKTLTTTNILASNIYLSEASIKEGVLAINTIKPLDDTNSLNLNGVKIDKDKNITDVSTINASGLIQALVFNATSDVRKKTNIKDYKCNKSILNLPIKSFEYINDESHTNYIGCIAQDLQEICPEIVTKDQEGYLSIQESKLVYLLLQEVKELKEKVELLERS